MPKIDLAENIDGRWTVTLPSLVLTDLSRETAEAFVAAYRRLKGPAAV